MLYTACACSLSTTLPQSHPMCLSSKQADLVMRRPILPALLRAAEADDQFDSNLPVSTTRLTRLLQLIEAENC
jgi:hypothetical protein